MAYDHVERAAMLENVSPRHVQKLRDIAAGIFLFVEYKPTRRVRGWPLKSEKPWSLRYMEGQLVCAFRTLAQLEKNLRDRAGC